MVSTTAPWWREGAVRWSAHGWSLEVRGDELAEIRHGSRIVLRAVRAAVRDHGWLTVPATVLERRSEEDGLILSLRHEGLGALIDSHLVVRATADSLRIEWDATNVTDLDTCRTGLVALHPASDAGTAATVVHPDGARERVMFPSSISPHQPISGIRELLVDGGPRLRFEGDVFEMEDQRNWTDASFKTYSRPLDLPYPYRLDAGARVRQSITIGAPAPSPPAAGAHRIPVIELVETTAVPEIGVEASTAPDPVPASDAGAFRVVELDLATPTWPAALRRAAADGLPLDVRLITDASPAPLSDAARALRGLRIARVTPFDAMLHVTDAASMAATRTALAEHGLRVPLLAGARSHFTELNRERSRLPGDAAGIVVNSTPLFHTIDTEQLIESLPIQRLIAAQTVHIAEGRPVHIGPVSLRPRFNNVATAPEPAPTCTDLSEGYGAEFTGASDARQRAPELAAWVIGSAAALAVPGVSSLSWFETWGARGLADRSGPTPAADAIAALASLTGGALLTGDSPDGLVWALGASVDGADAVLAANLDRGPRRISIRTAGGSVTVDLDGGTWKRLDISAR